MKLNTKHFGELEIDDDIIIEFDEGIPGFCDYKRFVILTEEESSEWAKNLCWLQSIDDPRLCFVLIDPVSIFPDYSPAVDETELSGLGEYNSETFSMLNIAKFPDDIKETTVNLKAPILINNELKKGKQVICNNDEYSIKHYLFK